MALQDVAKSLLSGDNFSKLIGVGILILTATNFFKIGNQADETRAEVDRQAAITRAQVREIYKYQLYFLRAMPGWKADNNKLLSHFDLGPSSLPDPPEITPIPFDGQ